MPKFRKRPVIIEARQFSANGPQIAQWCGGRWCPTQDRIVAPNGEVAQYHDPEHIDIKTLEGTMRAYVGDFIICGVNGEFYPCKPDIFAATYEPA